MFVAGQAELTQGLYMALRRSERVQPFSLYGVRGHALTTVMHESEVIESVGVALRRRKSEPADRLAHVLRETTPAV